MFVFVSLQAMMQLDSNSGKCLAQYYSEITAVLISGLERENGRVNHSPCVKTFNFSYSCQRRTAATDRLEEESKCHANR